MRGGSGANPRQQWYDRNPSTAIKAYSTSAAPHADTIRWTYTVPAGRKAIVELAQCAIMRYTAAAPADLASSYIIYRPLGAGNAVDLIAYQVSNTIGAQNPVEAGGSYIMLATDVLEAHTSDSSTGGIEIFTVLAKYTEFDA